MIFQIEYATNIVWVSKYPPCHPQTRWDVQTFYGEQCIDIILGKNLYMNKTNTSIRIKQTEAEAVPSSV